MIQSAAFRSAIAFHAIISDDAQSVVLLNDDRDVTEDEIAQVGESWYISSAGSDRTSPSASLSVRMTAPHHRPFELFPPVNPSSRGVMS